MEKLKELPKGITPAYLQVVVMPNGEIISLGKSIGFFKTFADYLYEDKKGE